MLHKWDKKQQSYFPSFWEFLSHLMSWCIYKESKYSDQGQIQSWTLGAIWFFYLSLSCKKFLYTIVCYRKCYPLGTMANTPPPPLDQSLIAFWNEFLLKLRIKWVINCLWTWSCAFNFTTRKSDECHSHTSNWRRFPMAVKYAKQAAKKANQVLIGPC